MLGEKDYLFGAEPALLDLTVFGVLSQLTSVDPDYPCPLRDYLTTETPNLAALLTRLRERVWADHWEAATGTTLELNPHIPKVKHLFCFVFSSGDIVYNDILFLVINIFCFVLA